MKLIFQFVFFISFISDAFSQDLNSVLLGEWMLNPEYEEANVIIFRSDQTYIVYNEFEVSNSGKEKYDVLFDNLIIRTALIEKGEWFCDESNNTLSLQNRFFYKSRSSFNRLDSENLSFKIKKINENQYDFCLLENDETCDLYAKNMNHSSYKERHESFSGSGQDTFKMSLSGYETELVVSYEFYQESDKLIIQDLNGGKIFSTDFQSTTKTQIKKIQIKGLTELSFKVDSQNANSKWKINIDIK